MAAGRGATISWPIYNRTGDGTSIRVDVVWGDEGDPTGGGNQSPVIQDANTETVPLTRTISATQPVAFTRIPWLQPKVTVARRCPTTPG